jgi:FtsP/CotA-like multicopper oxidase with cupredoxin domain
MTRLRAVILALTTTASPALAQQAGAPLAIAPVAINDNSKGAGRVEDQILVVALRAGIGRWSPEGDRGTAHEIEAFGEEGRPLTIPAPLIRARSGTVVHVTVRNTLRAPLVVHGLCDRPGACEPMTIAPGATGEVRFTLKAGGTYHYWATTTGQPLLVRDGADSQLGGAIIADDGEVDPRERVFVMSMLRNVPGVVGGETPVINGVSWPHNGRLHHTVGDTIRWRVINLTAAAHSMHLHGFYFNVEATGDGTREARHTLVTRPPVVTERIPVGGSFTMSWVPERAGNWLFHCHMLTHMMPEVDSGAPAHHAPAAAGMAGLVLGVEVTGPSAARVGPDSARRTFRMVINPDSRFPDSPSYKVDITSNGSPLPRLNDRSAPGPVLVVTRGEPVAVEIANQIGEPTAIHWHGIELESYHDGVADFGGSVGSITPPVTPKGTFTARFTPSRAGTFIYHTHWHDANQLSGGIYGPLIVLEPGQNWNPETDRIIVIGLEGRYRTLPNEPFAINGEREPRPLELKAGVAHRLRLINITGDGVSVTLQLLSVHDPVRWTPLGKDGRELPPADRVSRPSRQQVAVGETYDFELAPMAPRSEGLWLELRRGSGELVVQWPVRVR